jgi:hypothetical protein
VTRRTQVDEESSRLEECAHVTRSILRASVLSESEAIEGQGRALYPLEA